MTIPRPEPPRQVPALQGNCPLVRAALRIGDPRVLDAVARIHPALCCPEGTCRVTGVVDQAVDELLDRSDERDRYETRIGQAWTEGYMAGARDRWASGYVSAIADVKRIQHRTVKQLAPGGAAWVGSVKRNGGTEYGGAGKPRVPVGLVAIELADMMRRGTER